MTNTHPPPSARIIAVAGRKGGSGKTTTSLNLAGVLAEQGQRVLLTATGATPVPVCVTCRPLHLDSASSGDAD